MDSTVGETVITIPVDPAIPLTVSRGDISVDVTLPFSGVADNAEVLKQGVVSHGNGNGSVTVPIAKDEGVLQMATVINGAPAPNEYDYGFSLSGGAQMSLEDGTVIVRSSEGKFIGLVAPAWARDANGAYVPTRYEINGTQLTQVIDHSTDYAYPIVAAPTYAPMLFTNASVDTYNAQARVNLTPGWWSYGVTAPVVDVQGWIEATTQWGSKVSSALESKTTMRQQFSCHAYGSWFAGQWNLERFRPTRTTHWSYGVAVHHCNWVTANQH